MRTQLTTDQMAQVNGAGVKEVVEAIIEVLFGGIMEETKNDVPH